MNPKNLMASIAASPLVVKFLEHYAPYFPYIQACSTLVLGDIILGILADCYKKYDTLHPAAIFKTFKSAKLKKKIAIGVLFFAGIFFIDSSDILLQKLNAGPKEAAVWWCVAYGLYELTSILEKMGQLDFPVAKQIKNWINSKVPEEMKNKDEEKKGEE